MSTDEMVSVVYNYSKRACRSTSFDYRDVAHNVLVKQLSRFRQGIIRHAKAYMYLAVSCTLAGMMKAQSKNGIHCELYSNIPTKENCEACMELEETCQVLSKNERYIVHRTLEGYSRQEIAEQLGMNRSNVNVIWHRMVQGLREAV